MCYDRDGSMNTSTANLLAAAEPPPGMVPNFAHPKDVYHTVDILVQGLSLVIMTAFFAIRVYVKMVIKRGETLLEDCTLIDTALALLCCTNLMIGFCGASWVRLHHAR